MTKSFKAVILIGVIVLQVTVLSHFKPLSVVPNYIFTVIVAMSVLSANTETIAFAALAGLLTDMLTGAAIGLNTLICMYLSVACVLISDFIYNKRIKLLIPVCFVMSFIYELAFGIFSSLFRGASFYPLAIVKVVLPVAAINTVIFIPVYIFMSKLRFEKKRKGIKYERSL